MKAATTSKRYFEKTKMMVVDSSLPQKVLHRTVGDLTDFLQANDLLIVNHASTLPASFQGRIQRSGQRVEVRLAAFNGTSPSDLRRWSAVLFGDGDWRLPTEERGLAAKVAPGDIIDIDHGLYMIVLSVDALLPRLLEIEFASESLVRDLFTKGRPIQYSYHEEDLEIWDQQSIFHGAPVSVEPPSSAFPLTWDLLLKLRKKGVAIAPILHSAGLSSTGDKKLDARLPLNEFFEVSTEVLTKIKRARAQGGRVIALGTSVARAIESALASGKRTGLTSLKLGKKSQIRGIDILITGMHESGTSHAELMKAFCDCESLNIAEKEANAHDYRSHEFGDWTLLNCTRKLISLKGK